MKLCGQASLPRGQAQATGQHGVGGEEMRVVRPGSGLDAFVVHLVRQDPRLPETRYEGAWEAAKGAWKLLVNEEGIVTPP